jgi:predicted GNAT family acetyltransferase
VSERADRTTVRGTARRGSDSVAVMEAVVIHVPGAQRYELRDGDELLGFVDYRPAGDSVIVAHTESAAAHAGEGLGGTLVRGVFAQIAADGKTVIPTCPFAAAYVARNPELVEHVAPSWRGRFGTAS